MPAPDSLALRPGRTTVTGASISTSGSTSTGASTGTSGSTAHATRRPSSRDPFLDLVRTWAILRVVTVHILGLAPIPLLWWPAPQFIAPGMPLVFFVSGALALASLDPAGRKRMSARTFWHDRLRRLMLPYWVYYLIAASVTVALDLSRGEDSFTINFTRTAVGAVPLIDPITSPAGFLAVVHLWFLVCFLQIILIAPLLARAHRAAPRLVLASSATVWLGVSYLQLHTSVRVFPEISAFALFQFFFVLGFWYSDGRLVAGVPSPLRPPGRVLLTWPTGLVVPAIGFAAAAAVWRWESPLAVHDSPAVHGLLGLSWLAVILLAREPLTRLAVRLARPLAVLTKRTLTIYLYGWPTAALVGLAIHHLGWTGWPGTIVFIAGSILALTAAVKIFGRVEDLAAGRAPRRTVASVNSAR